MTITHLITDGVYVSAQPKFLAEKSAPEKSVYVYSYEITIKNERKKAIQLKKRSWTITDAFLNREYVEGDGVIGEYPLINPDETYSYTGYCKLKTNFGTMNGYYLMLDEDGSTIKVLIPDFILAHPFAIQ